MHPYMISSCISCSHIVAEVPITFIMPVHPSACISMAPTGWIFMKFDIGDFMIIYWEKRDLVTIGQNCQELHEDLSFSIASNLKSLHQCSLRVK